MYNVRKMNVNTKMGRRSMHGTMGARGSGGGCTTSRSDGRWMMTTTTATTAAAARKETTKMKRKRGRRCYARERSNTEDSRQVKTNNERGGGEEEEENGTQANGSGNYVAGNGVHKERTPRHDADGLGGGGNATYNVSNEASATATGDAADGKKRGAGSPWGRARRSLSRTLSHDTEYLDSWDFWKRKWRDMRGRGRRRKRNSQLQKSMQLNAPAQQQSSSSSTQVVKRRGWFSGGGDAASASSSSGGGGDGYASDDDTYGFWSDFDSTSAPEYFNEEPELVHSRPKDLLQVITAVVIGPLVVSTSARLVIIEPALNYHARGHPESFSVTSSQRLEVARRVEDWERGIRYEQLMGRAPRLGDRALEEELRDEASRFEDDARRRNIRAVGNVVTDVTLASVIAGGIVANRQQLVSFRQRLGRLFFGLGASQQAVFILLVADVLVGYHSSDGWVAFISLCLEHYGISPQGNEAFVSLFVATVPVLLDVTFKYWVFSKLRRLSPSTQVILDELERH